LKLDKTALDVKQNIRRQFLINGIVQGVGFRPFIYRIALQFDLSGFVCNNSDGVCIEVQGQADNLEKFRACIANEAPPLSRIKSVLVKDIPPTNESNFHIDLTENNHAAHTFIAPDVCVCDECLTEMQDPPNRRYHYPFINCTNCGPRFTIIQDIPYDRPATSMGAFPLCPRCAKEYNDPLDRRFHAQPNACPDCGPRLFLHDADGRALECDDPLSETIARLKSGKIGAIRGLGGFHLAVDAFNPGAILDLRKRKGRPTKPLALMARDIDVIKKFCFVSSDEQVLLQSLERPIVLLRKKLNSQLTETIAPNNNYIGFMLPYTPLHFLLLGPFDALVMTSGNYSDEPIAIKNDEAFKRLQGIADFFLVHNREILHRCDDSIVRAVAGSPRLVRRSRGYVPAPFFLQFKSNSNILACGAELKNSIALCRSDELVFGPHIGDLDNPKAFAFFEESIAHLCAMLQIKPDLIACDLHPDYLASKWARKQNLPLVEVQHHHAHLAAVMAENHISDPTIGIILDGTGYGTDGTIWGGEVLIGDFKGFERFAWLEPVPLPGGTAAIKQPWRTALSYLMHAFGDEWASLPLPFFSSIKTNDLNIVQTMVHRGLNSPLSSSCGRLFDAVSALLGVCIEASFEAEAAIMLEMQVAEKSRDVYSNVLTPLKNQAGALSMDNLIKHLVFDFMQGVPVAEISARFHNTLAKFFVNVALNAREKHGIKKVTLGGGVFQNNYFFTTILQGLMESGFDVLTPSVFPANDGGLALGQVAIAASVS